MNAATVTEAEPIARAREVLERARSEHNAWTGGRVRLLRVTAAMACLQDAILRDKTMAAHWSGRVVAVIEDVMGPEAATYVGGGEGEW